MKAAVILIFYTGIFYGLYLIYCLLNYKYGKKIRDYRQRQLQPKEAYIVIREGREKTALKFLESNRVELVEVEEVNEVDRPLQWKVRYNEALTKHKTILIE